VVDMRNNAKISDVLHVILSSFLRRAKVVDFGGFLGVGLGDGNADEADG